MIRGRLNNSLADHTVYTPRCSGRLVFEILLIVVVTISTDIRLRTWQHVHAHRGHRMQFTFSGSSKHDHILRSEGTRSMRFNFKTLSPQFMRQPPCTR